MYEPDICIYHGDCDDGFGAAWVIRKRWPECEFAPGYYGKPLPLRFGNNDYPPSYDELNVLMVDFSAPARVLNDIGKTARSVVVLDHHKTAADALVIFPKIGTGESGHLEGVNVRFDMEKCGARLAWEFAFPGEEAPQLIDHLEDRDLWRPHRNEAVTAGLRSFRRDFDIWDDLFGDMDPNNQTAVIKQLATDGVPILRALTLERENLAAACYFGSIGGFRVPMVNCARSHGSDVAHLLLKEHPGAPFSATWFRGEDGYEFSLRSTNDREDVSEIAKLYGGGGHRNASGFLIRPRTVTPIEW